MTKDELKSFLSCNNFRFDPVNNAWKKYDLTIPSKIAEDLATMEEYERITWLADHGYCLGMINNEMFIMNGVITNNIGEFMQLPLHEVDKQHKDIMTKHTH